MTAPRGRPVATALLALFLIPASVQAGWLPNGTLVAGDVEDESSSHSIANGGGGVFVVWRQHNGADYDIYIQQLDRDGNELWTPGGVAVCTAAGNQSNPHVARDGTGGAIVSWDDLRTADSHIYARRVDASGAPVWTADGNPICTAPGYHGGNVILGDGAGGAFIAWNLGFGGSTDVYLQRVDIAGGNLWALNGVPLAATTDYQYNPRIASDGVGGVLVAWGDRRSGSWKIYAGRMDGNGTPLWTANGVPISGSTATGIPVVQVDGDGVGGFLVAWYNGAGSYAGGWAQRVSPTAAIQWGSNGLSFNYAGHVPSIANDGAGGAFIAWDGNASGLGYVWVQHVSPAGVGAWAPGASLPGMALVSNYGNSPLLATDGNGGIVTVWNDARNGATPQLFAQRVDVAAGIVSWVAGGVPVSLTPSARTLTGVVKSDETGVIAVWHDGDVYAQRIHSLAGDWGIPDALITGVADVPADEGGFVQVDWDASDRDGTVATTVTHYSLWRATDFIPAGAPLPAARSLAGEPVASRGEITADFRGAAYHVQTTSAGTYYWEWTGNVAATTAAAYSSAVPTRQDAVGGNPAAHYIQVLAHTANNFVFWESNVMTGASTDDLAPAAPLSLAAARNGNGSDVSLQWSPSGQNEPDFAEYAIYRSDSPGVPVTPANLLSSTTGTTLTDAGAPLTALYYVVVARDVHGNGSAPSNEAAIATPTGAGTPALTSLQVGPNAPNPFSGSTRISVGLPGAAPVSVDVYDVAGRRVASRRTGSLGAGWSTVEFDGRDDAGRRLPSGVYFCRVTAGSESRVRKIVVQR